MSLQQLAPHPQLFNGSGAPYILEATLRDYASVCTNKDKRL